MQIVTTTTIDSIYLDQIRAYADQVICCGSKDEALSYLGNADIVITDHVNFTLETLRNAPKLKWVQLLNAGADNLPLQALHERGVVLTNNRGIHRFQISEYVFSMMLYHARKLRHYVKLQSEKRWEPGFTGTELYCRTAGIIGTGAIGKEIAKKAKAFGMHVLGMNRTGRQEEHFDTILNRERIGQLMAESDFIIVSLPLTANTHHFLRYEHFRKMKETCYFINVSRGAVVKESDLIQALQNHEIAGAALDVFEIEPLPDNHPLWDVDNVMITPHHAGNSPEYLNRTFEMICTNLRLFTRGETLINIVDTKIGY